MTGPPSDAPPYGQTSLLLDAYPTEIEVIAKQIGPLDYASTGRLTLRQSYGWLKLPQACLSAAKT